MECDILYLCDQKKKCRASDICGQRYKYAGCIYTLDPKHAKNGPVKDQEDLNERFKHYKMGDIEFWEERREMKGVDDV